MSCSCLLLSCQSTQVLWSLLLIRGMDYSKWSFVRGQKEMIFLTILLLARITVKSERSSLMHLLWSHTVPLERFLCPGVLLTRGDVGFIINEVFLKNVSKALIMLKTGSDQFELVYTLKLSLNLPAFTLLPPFIACVLELKGLTNVGSDFFWSLLAFFLFFFVMCKAWSHFCRGNPLFTFVTLLYSQSLLPNKVKDIF